MTVQASTIDNPLTAHLVGLEALVAASSTFQGRIKPGATETDALKRIHLFEAEFDPEPVNFPVAVLAVDAQGAVAIGQGDQVELGASGDMVLILMDRPRDLDIGDAYLDFANFIGDVINDIENLSGQDRSTTTPRWPSDGAGKAHASYRSYRLMTNPRRSEREGRATNDYFIAVYGLSFSATGEEAAA